VTSRESELDAALIVQCVLRAWDEPGGNVDGRSRLIFLERKLAGLVEEIRQLRRIVVQVEAQTRPEEP